MTDRPIIFSAPMVRALLDGRKTQTRRLLKPQPPTGWAFVGVYAPHLTAVFDNGNSTKQIADCAIRIPFAPGDRLWVKEVWGIGISDHGDCPRYKATLDYQCGDKIKSPHEGPFKWKSPLFMPRRFSRFTLTVTDVRVQRLHDITDDDAIAEGATSRKGIYKHDDWSMDWSQIGKYSRHMGGNLTQKDIALGAPRWAFASYWNDIHGPDAWTRNDWVCALTFTVERRNIDQ